MARLDPRRAKKERNVCAENEDGVALEDKEGML